MASDLEWARVAAAEAEEACRQAEQDAAKARAARAAAELEEIARQDLAHREAMFWAKRAHERRLVDEVAELQGFAATLERRLEDQERAAFLEKEDARLSELLRIAHARPHAPDPAPRKGGR